MVTVVSVALVVAGLAVLGVLVSRVSRVLRRCGETASMVAARTSDRAGLLRARWAAVQVALDRRRRRARGSRPAQYDRA